MVGEYAFVDGNTSGGHETGGVAWRGGLRIETHHVKSSRDIGICVAGGDEAIRSIALRRDRAVSTF